MRKRLLVLLLALIAVAGLLPGGVLAQSYLLRTVDGVTYEYNQQITTILYAGVDSEGPMTTTDRYTIAPRADTINLIILDGYHGTLRVLAISRDTLTAIDRYTMDGTWRDTYVSHLGYAYTYGDGGRVSCENLVSAVSRLLGGVPIHEYVVTNKSGVAAGNAMVGGVRVTVPNDDVAHLHPELTAGAENGHPEFGRLLDACDWLIDGPFVLAERDLELQFRGSRNQRMIDLNATRREGKTVVLDRL